MAKHSKNILVCDSCGRTSLASDKTCCYCLQESVDVEMKKESIRIEEGLKMLEQSEDGK